ncbi:aldo/keto reductase [Microbacterium trichothecenolyticum]|uniref:Aryl-alcohol dehydrogenase-like predicted oxidoreductase n=1 Tax=Microbacterium trichothecenolyticum TaxID=69370 RepID=A0ABU0TYR2_MICTR|nr:aldo/keto reductase [Microbacterium trichothecenolyticum]MDQ1124784.1 aryl-alcohol dehydrogenase-like predicted oxidoreductase [Microbacterium trichothecenolyticum]
MQQRPLSRTGREVSAIGLGTWQLGPDWGGVSENDALAVLAASVDAGVTLFDTADVYGDGRSEEIIGRFLKGTDATGITVATKMGRRAEQVSENYTIENFRGWLDRSRRLLGTDTLDLVQLHCPPSAVIDDDATWEALDQLVAEGVIAAYGASVETMDQALSALRRPHLTNLQIIFNPFRLKPLDEVLPLAAEKNVAVLARVPLASGLLSGKYTRDTTFDKDDHRTYNRNGEAFDKGETFSGVPFDQGVAAADELKASLPEGVTLPAATLAWIASRDGVTSVIPGARSVQQAEANAAAFDLVDRGFDVEAFDALVRDVYDRRLRAQIHPQW